MVVLLQSIINISTTWQNKHIMWQ